ncbi:MAG: hypothetical protein ACOX5A_07935 [Aminivibrio sp.]|jgi:hypothetical protein
MTEIKRLLMEKNLSTHKLHKLIGGNRSAVFEVAGGRRRASKGMREKISTVLCVDEEELFDRSGMAKGGAGVTGRRSYLITEEVLEEGLSLYEGGKRVGWIVETQALEAVESEFFKEE